MNKRIHILACLLTFGPWHSPLTAQTTPRLLPFQGRLTDQNGVAVSNGVRLVQFKIFEVPSGGTPVWAGELHRTTVNGGLVNVLLGSKTPFTGVDFDRQVYLEITMDINGDNSITVADPPMLPRQAILPVVFAKEAADSRLLKGYDWSAILVGGATNPYTGKIGGAKIEAGGITSLQLAANSVASSNIIDGTIAVTKLTPKQIGTNVSIGGLALSTASSEFVVTAPVYTGAEATPTNWTDVPGLQVRIATSGRPIMVGLTGNTNGLRTMLNLTDDYNGTGGGVAYWEVLNEYGNVVFRYNQLIRAAPQPATTGVSMYTPVSAILFIDVPLAGQHTYKLRVQPQQFTPGVVVNAGIYNCRLFAFEL